RGAAARDRGRRARRAARDRGRERGGGGGGAMRPVRGLAVVLASALAAAGPVAALVPLAATPAAAQPAERKAAEARSEKSDGSGAAERDRLNGFVISRQLVDRDDIIPGGPPRDGIRSIDAPEFTSVEEATWVDDTTPVLGVVVGGDARAYPVHLMDYHQIANDVVGGVPIVVT